MFDIILSILLGIFLGTITGLIPGIHPNTIAFLILYFSPFFLKIFTPEQIVALAVSMSVTHSFTSFIPSIFLSAPEESTSLSLLPGHRMLLKGEGFEAIRLSVVGGVNSVLFLLFLLPIITYFVEFAYDYVRRFVSFILILVLIYLISMHRNKLSALLIVIYSGIVGYLSLNNYYLRADQVFLSMFTGMFALSTIFMSLKSRIVKLPRQKFELRKDEHYKESFLSAISSIFLSLIPSMSPSQIITIAQSLFRIRSEKSYMVMIGGITTADAIMSILALFLIGNPRSGISVFVEKFLGEISLEYFLLILSSILISVGISSALTIEISKYFLKIIQKLNYFYLNIFIFIFLIIIIYLFSGFYGLIIGITSMQLGILCYQLNVQKSLTISCLMIPTILYYLPG